MPLALSFTTYWIPYADDTLILFWSTNSYLLSGELGFRFSLVWSTMPDCITDKNNHFLKPKLFQLLDFDFHGLYFPMLHLKNSTLLLANSLNSLSWASCQWWNCYCSDEHGVKKLFYNSCDITFVYKYCTNRQGIRVEKPIAHRMKSTSRTFAFSSRFLTNLPCNLWL